MSSYPSANSNVICNGCYEEISKIREKKKRKVKKAVEDTNKGPKILCPFLLEAQRERENKGEQLTLEEFAKLVVEKTTPDTSAHYFQQFEKLFEATKFSMLGSQPEKEGTEVNLGDAEKLLAAVNSVKEKFSEEQQKTIDRIKKKVDFAVEREKNLDEWVNLTELTDLQKLRSALDSPHFQKVLGTLSTHILPKMQQQQDSPKSTVENNVKNEFWNTVVAAAKLCLKRKEEGLLTEEETSVAAELIDGVKKITGGLSSKQHQQIDQYKEQIIAK